MKIKVFIADDHPIVREGLKQIIADTKDIVVAGEAGNYREIIDKLNEEIYDVILLDVSIPGMDGLELIKRLRTKRLTTPVLILSYHPAEQYAVRFIRAGASGYLTKESAPDELIEAIRTVYDGQRYITPIVAEKLAQFRDAQKMKLPHEKLSDREFQVMCLISEGLPPKQIAVKLSITPRTVNTYRARIFQKTKFKSNAELTRYVIEQKLSLIDL